MAEVSDPRVVAALIAAVKQIEAAIADTEKGVNRILGLVALLMERADKDGYLKLEGIMEACSFQDLSGQKLRKIERLLEHLQTKAIIKVPGTVDLAKAQATRRVCARAPLLFIQTSVRKPPFRGIVLRINGGTGASRQRQRACLLAENQHRAKPFGCGRNQKRTLKCPS